MQVQKFYQEYGHSVEALGTPLVSFRVRDVLHVHLGLFGRIRSRDYHCRNLLAVCSPIGDTHCIDINGPAICEVMGPAETKVLFNRIGPDILRSDAEPIRAFARRQKVSCHRAVVDGSVCDCGDRQYSK